MPDTESIRLLKEKLQAQLDALIAEISSGESTSQTKTNWIEAETIANLLCGATASELHSNILPSVPGIHSFLRLAKRRLDSIGKEPPEVSVSCGYPNRPYSLLALGFRAAPQLAR